ncbi:cyclin-D-binding Myb-like transcription factor 1 [Ornithodoros turicata]|uniref:cyclin-D-binding Myb-like transcription factor 1 n=1 Tax=Ornithodoros turicata TaxID=34597 RepID=UPI0031394E13
MIPMQHSFLRMTVRTKRYLGRCSTQTKVHSKIAAAMMLTYHMSHDERPGSPVDHSFMEYAVRGEFPDIHKSSVEPAPGTIEAYEEQTGMTLRKHHFSAEEDAILKRNFKNIAKFFNLQHPHLILGHKGTQSSTEVQNAKKFAQQQKVLQLLGKDLPRRSLRMIYRRARALFHPLRMDTRITFNKEESDQVMALYARLGPKWHEIEKVMEKPADSIRVHFLQLEEKKYDVEKGRWEIEEEIRLQKAMRKFGHTEHNGRLPSGVTWEKIAKEVGTRGPIQCYKRWVYAFRRTERTKGHIKLWNIYDTMHLINEMYHIENMPCNDYDWKLINRRFPAAKKATTLCDRWKRLISTKVPNSKEMSMKEGAAYLYRYYLPALLSRRNISIERAVELSMCPRLKG